MAPVHFYLRHRDESGRITNLETTSGALPARDVWIRQTRQVSDRGIETGFYMRSLSRREGVAAMALTIVEHLMGQRQFREAVAVLEIILRHNPRDGIAWANLGNAYHRILQNEFLDRYGSHFLIPLQQRANYLMLLQRNHAAFAAAKALGWEPVQ
jgi:tetratricopeptide (TPR) repeat protein